MTKIVFMGTPEFAVASLRTLIQEGYEIAAVVTQPDRPVGRKRVLMPTPVKAEALQHGLTVWQPEKLRTSDTVDDIRALQPDLIVTAAYGQILPKAVLDIPRLGCINVHGSLLPKYRGGAPIQRSIMNGETVTGVTIMYMAEGMDTGDMISRVEVPIGADDNAGTMFAKLSEAGADLLRRTLPDIIAGRVEAVPQPHDEATYAPNLKREDERIDWTRSAEQIANQVRGLVPFSGAFTTWSGEVFKVWACRPEPAAAGEAAAAPGTVLTAGTDGLRIQTGQGILSLLEVQPAGKKAMPASEFLRGGKMEQGTVLS
ncbi:methionyl-tRNA formyltransferase [Paenibacillus thiaminolyticus]|uniref:Methionyl-tRNA formyltransferase n=1 Tax=Paenibacillus thiaminolyticus TaxID=49283 RepID=A0AAP9DYN8_PANTH|nr:methionyl-tRNA formyltransferase [Paenibacillus thiaminolyticus]MCY9534475.1 methionyl-tRNA formyltransferase [Paenibacillus thiaminolyticus]MCY9601285.1 methionyl-tRNA formyltransferase [Paenibacillus thiaminolyticus]MCY9606486.1 methionyl-tRNA formyltransferase [Paenibacillus thiaminolyticus]MCY9614086.1 methionyl-tRNA formyltransferase [Paenibacillus thiaminolyticus]MCY9618623.1 methionyl-tRNA formyltransferase [Paenibacillus thiaminolyticus]